MGSINGLWIPTLVCAHLLGVFLFFHAKEQLYGTVTNFKRTWARRLGLARPERKKTDAAHTTLEGFHEVRPVGNLCRALSLDIAERSLTAAQQQPCAELLPEQTHQRPACLPVAPLQRW